MGCRTVQQSLVQPHLLLLEPLLLRLVMLMVLLVAAHRRQAWNWKRMMMTMMNQVCMTGRLAGP